MSLQPESRTAKVGDGGGKRSIWVRSPLGRHKWHPQAVLEQLRCAREDLKVLIKEKNCNPILVRLAWHDAGTYNQNISGWPFAGGAIGTIRYHPQLSHESNAGLVNAIKLLDPIREKYPAVSNADLLQLAGATAIEMAGGPTLPMKYGRIDAPSEEFCAPDNVLPMANPPDPAAHLRGVFYRMGFTDNDIVALSGAHTLGRARPERSGFGKIHTPYTKDGPGAPGGQSWTKEWLKFDNGYYKEVRDKTDEHLLVLPTDAVLFQDEGFKVYAEKYAEDQDAFFRDYAEAHVKLSNLGCKFDPSQGIRLGDHPSQLSYRRTVKALTASLNRFAAVAARLPQHGQQYTSTFLWVFALIAMLAVVVKLLTWDELPLAKRVG
ncbi:hypothetical protein CBR_g30060 [Chara braunii]|uniref:L-ascorbate peroxidase n=1 Tax=Chara braunii TaxID=69332 RepID=A0A388LBW5_CHABU|nr:hypothetical protein CBR_g30060 [Chara braunii]|eukprot:GBG79798.1 hypothetical protein CBR_g30060 [Chara braunii]